MKTNPFMNPAHKRNLKCVFCGGTGFNLEVEDLRGDEVMNIHCARCGEPTDFEYFEDDNCLVKIRLIKLM